jgi:hypothetical protein
MARMIFAPSTAPANAASTSAASPLGTVSTSDPSNGLLTSIFALLSTHLPATNIFMGSTYFAVDACIKPFASL